MTRKAKKTYDDSWMYILLLTTLTILLYSLSTYKFSIAGITLTYSVLGLPLIFFITNYITKKYNYAKAISAISISGVSMVLFILIMNFVLGKSTILSSMSGHFCGYVISQFVNLMIYYFILQNTSAKPLLVFLTYLFSLIVFYMFYTLIYLNMVVEANYWKGYFISLGLQSVICLVLTIIDNKLIKRGKDD
ncbi:MAG: hypothetical protein PUC82_02255 [bacterium]|nr:hypothetical protein [bacterium]